MFLFFVGFGVLIIFVENSGVCVFDSGADGLVHAGVDYYV